MTALITYNSYCKECNRGTGDYDTEAEAVGACAAHNRDAHPEGREELARDVFLADNDSFDCTDDWKTMDPAGRTYAYGIADGLLARGYGKVKP